MNVKKIMLAVMCLLLVIMVVMTGIFVNRIGQLLQGFLGGGNSPAGSTTVPTNTPPITTAPPTTVPPTTVPPTTVPPTTAPTEPGHTHEYVLEEQVGATCEGMGYDIMICTGCGNQDIQNMVDSIGHDYGPGQTIAPTCTEAGCTRSVCNRCGNIRERNQKEPLGHDYNLVESVTAACGVAGYDKKVCDRCEEEVLENEVPALEHQDMVLESIQATCTADGTKKVLCLLCTRVEEILIPATGHSFGQWVTDANGTTRTCTVCGEVERDIPVTSHVFGVWMMDDSGASRVCTICGESEIIAATDFKITSKTHLPMGSSRTVFIQVGTDQHPDLAVFSVYHPTAMEVEYTLDAARGLVVTYLDGSGESVEKVIAFSAERKTLVISVG